MHLIPPLTAATLAVLLLAAGPAIAEDPKPEANAEPNAEAAPATASEPDGNPVQMELGDGWTARLFGRLRGDAVWDDSRPNNPRLPFFIPSESAAAGGTRNRGSLIMHPRLSRIGVAVERSEWSGMEDMTVTGLLEMDFFALASPEAGAEVRLRHAYVEVGRRWPASGQTFTLLAGQTDDVVSPITPEIDGDMRLWAYGNLGDRRPQFRVFYEWREGTFANTTTIMAGLTNAVDARDADGNLIADGERSERPTIQGRTGLHLGLPFISDPMRLFFSWHRSWMTTDTRIGRANRSHHQSWAVSLSLDLPLIATGTGRDRYDVLWMRGEVWKGKHLSDIRGGINQGLNAFTGTGIASTGGWAELGIRPAAWLSLSGGAGADDPDNDDGPAVASNHALFAAAAVTIDQVRFGAEYVWRRTGYLGAGPGTSNRVRFFMELTF